MSLHLLEIENHQLSQDIVKFAGCLQEILKSIKQVEDKAGGMRGKQQFNLKHWVDVYKGSAAKSVKQVTNYKRIQ